MFAVGCRDDARVLIGHDADLSCVVTFDLRTTKSSRCEPVKRSKEVSRKRRSLYDVNLFESLIWYFSYFYTAGRVVLNLV